MLRISLSKHVFRLLKYNFSQQIVDYSKDYYKILGVEEGADAQTIKQKFYTLAKEHHPDKSDGSVDIFRLCNEAYTVLGDEVLRREYDSKRSRTEGGQEKQKQDHFYNLNYEPYSQTSKMQWAIYRKGWRKNQMTHHYNYEQNIISGEMGFTAKDQQVGHWDLPLSLVTQRQIKEEKQRNQAIERKLQNDARDFLIAKDKVIDQEIERMRNSLKKNFILSKFIFLFDMIAKKSPQEQQWSAFLREEEKKRDEQEKKKFPN